MFKTLNLEDDFRKMCHFLFFFNVIYLYFITNAKSKGRFKEKYIIFFKIYSLPLVVINWFSCLVELSAPRLSKTLSS